MSKKVLIVDGTTSGAVAQAIGASRDDTRVVKTSPEESSSVAGLVLSMSVGFAGSYAPYRQPQCTPFNHFWRQRGRNLICSVCNEVRGRANSRKR